jgi:hypothetical protein
VAAGRSEQGLCTLVQGGSPGIVGQKGQELKTR